MVPVVVIGLESLGRQFGAASSQRANSVSSDRIAESHYTPMGGNFNLD
jgi:hypothetical protein